MKIIIPSLFLVVLFTIVFASFRSNSKYETASYSVKKEVSENVEVRLYENLMLLTNYSSAGDNENDMFMSLFRFITGSNSKEEKIQMTTPVFKSTNNDVKTMSFVIPNKYKDQEVPKKTEDGVVIKNEEIKNIEVLAIRFSGSSKDKYFKKKEQELKQIAIDNKIEADFEHPIKVYYNAPFVLPFFKRNEIMYVIKGYKFL